LHKPIVEQPVYNLFEQYRFNQSYNSVYKDHRLGATTWSPLASGLLTGKYKDGIPSDSRGARESLDWMEEKLTNAEQLAKVEALRPLAEQMGASLAQFSIAWCLQNASVSTVMTGASRVEQVHENMRAIDFADQFTPDLMSEIDLIVGET